MQALDSACNTPLRAGVLGQPVGRRYWGFLAVAISYAGGLVSGALLMYAWIDRLLGGPYIQKAEEDPGGGFG